MRIVQGLESYRPDSRPSAVALGVFDGVHLAHRAILGTAVARARAEDHVALACTFDRHPAEILQPDRAPAPITTLDQRLGPIARAGRFLGHPYFISGSVTSGAGRGRTLGFPTANIAFDRTLLVPRGVYLGRLTAEGRPRQAVVNVGVRPTFGETTLAVEAHVL